ncbi:MAG: hypothetical protein IT260_09155 [Saprospiraceae bacterium]|nr:hypothetical protein [Saprospiraceae bacterium]
MQTTLPPAKRTQYPLSVLLIVVVHLALGYLMYQKITQPNPGATQTEANAIAAQPETPAVP